MNWKGLLPGLVFAGAILWGTFLLNQHEPAPRPEPDPLDHYFVLAAQRQVELIRATRNERIEILTLEGMGYGLSRQEAQEEARADIEAEISYLLAEIESMRGAPDALP